MSVLNPTPPSLEQQLMDKLAEYERRCAHLERTRTTTAVGDGVPSGATIEGTRYVNRLTDALYIYLNAGWRKIGVTRGSAYASGTLSLNANANWQNHSDLSVTVSVPARDAAILVQVEAELSRARVEYMDNQTPTIIRAGTAMGVNVTGITPNMQLIRLSDAAAYVAGAAEGDFVRLVSQPIWGKNLDTDSGSDPLGGLYPNGGLVAIRPTCAEFPCSVTVSARYKQVNFTSPVLSWPTVGRARDRALRVLVV